MIRLATPLLLALCLSFAAADASAGGVIFGGKKKPDGSGEAPALPPTPDAPPDWMMIRGALQKQANGLTLKTCGKGDVLRLQEPSKDSDAARALMDTLAGGGGALFAELGVAPQADETYQMLSLNRVLLPGGGANQGCGNGYAADEVWRIAGWSPAYTLSITQETMVLRRPQARNNPARFPANMPTQTPGGGWHYEGTAPAVGIAGYTLDLTPGLCRESGTGNLFGWRAVLVVDGNLLAGCASSAFDTSGKK